jgi:pyrroline-5-carboxylate reductase
MTNTSEAADRSALAHQRIGFIGCGAMASALAGGLRAAGIESSQLAGSDPSAEQCERFARATGGEVGSDNARLVAASDLVVVAVKPGIVAGALSELGDAAAKPLWISIAAGVSLAALAASLPRGSRIVRAMPNTPALAGAAATGFCANAAASPADRASARALFEAVGSSWEAPSEDLIDAVTGLSGSGPAFVFVFLEALAEAGARQGLPADAALQLATQTVYGAAKLVLETGRHPASLKDQVTSPGGTTLAGLEALERAGLRPALYAAVEAATRRSRELGES